MSYALGQPVTLTQLVRDSAGALANAATAALTITLPDGTTVSPTVTNPPAVTGTYTYTYTPTATGLFGVRWVFLGTNAQAPLIDSIYVESSTVAPMVSLAEARKQCRLSSTSEDQEVLRFALIASALCEDYTKLWRRQTVVATFDGGRPFLRLRAPVLSITSVTEDDVAVASTDYVLNGARGQLYRGSTSATWCWSPGVQNVAVTYVAGVGGAIPPQVRQGVLLLVQHLWDSQRGGSGLPGVEGADFEVDPRTGYTIPNAVLEEWRTSMPVLVA